ncbi:MAG: hypothetical protein H7A46_01450 [Verrucomicrobiales bacterium]|nr:hypothetical protein [Verrucomicrobiales bacterium]
MGWRLAAPLARTMAQVGRVHVTRPTVRTAVGLELRLRLRLERRPEA